MEALDEVGHGGDTQVNKSLNQTISWYAPKNKTYAGSVSLLNQIGIALGIHSVGIVEYFSRLLLKLEIDPTPELLYFLQSQQKGRANRINKSKTKTYKKLRNKKLHERLQQYSETAKKEIAKKEGVYQPGIGMNGGYTECTETTTTTKICQCSACGLVNGDHIRPWSKKCPKYHE